MYGSMACEPNQELGAMVAAGDTKKNSSGESPVLYIRTFPKSRLMNRNQGATRMNVYGCSLAMTASSWCQINMRVCSSIERRPCSINTSAAGLDHCVKLSRPLAMLSE